MSEQRPFSALAGPNIQTNFDGSCLEYGLTEHLLSSSTEQLFKHEGAASYAVSMNKIGFGERLQQRRKELGISGESLGKGLQSGGKDASRATISDWEAERHYPNVWQLREICLKLNMNADFFLFGEISNANTRVIEQIKSLVLAGEAKVEGLSTSKIHAFANVNRGKPVNTDMYGEGKIVANASIESEQSRAFRQLLPYDLGSTDERKTAVKVPKPRNSGKA